MVGNATRRVADVLSPTRQGRGISKQKVLSYIVLVLAAVPNIIPNFSAFIAPEWKDAMIGLAALGVIIAREMQKDL